MNQTILHAALLSHVPRYGTIYGTLLNYCGALEALGDAVNQAPYKAPPKAPVLYIKPRNTLIGATDPIAVPADAPELHIGATLGIVIGRTACALAEAEALSHVAGYVVVNDVSVPHASYYRPSVRFKCRDRSCPIGPIASAASVGDPDMLSINVWLDGLLVQQNSTANMIRSVPRLLADVTDFMTLQPGDVLLTGVPEQAPRARAGQRVTVEIERVGRLDNLLLDEVVVVAATALAQP